MKTIETKFEEMGARIKINRLKFGNDPIVDIKKDRKGEFFDLSIPVDYEDSQIQILDCKPSDRHLLMMFREPTMPGHPDRKTKLLCGHDERHWFVAATNDRASNVVQAKEYLKPSIIREMQDNKGERGKERNNRKNSTFKRQGEWFFVPAPELKVNSKLILKNEPLRRNMRSKSHFMEFAYRSGGESVWTHPIHAPVGINNNNYFSVEIRKDSRWRKMMRNPILYAKGRITHADHSTVNLPCWHRVYMNTESGSTSVAFLD